MRTAALLEVSRFVESAFLEEMRQSLSRCFLRTELVQVLARFERTLSPSFTRIMTTFLVVERTDKRIVLVITHSNVKVTRATRSPQERGLRIQLDVGVDEGIRVHRLVAVLLRV